MQTSRHTWCWSRSASAAAKRSWSCDTCCRSAVRCSAAAACCASCRRKSVAGWIADCSIASSAHTSTCCCDDSSTARDRPVAAGRRSQQSWHPLSPAAQTPDHRHSCCHHQPRNQPRQSLQHGGTSYNPKPSGGTSHAIRQHPIPYLLKPGHITAAPASPDRPGRPVPPPPHQPRLPAPPLSPCTSWNQREAIGQVEGKPRFQSWSARVCTDSFGLSDQCVG